MIVLLRVLLALVGLVGSPTTTGDAATYAYDAPTIARVDVRHSFTVETETARLSGALDRVVSASFGGRATSTTPYARGVATNTAGLVDDAAGVAFRTDTSHIFRNAAGHLVEDTAANRALLQSAVSPGTLVAERTIGSSVLRSYQRLLPDGRQVWVEVRNGVEITNGGVNAVAK